MKIKRGKHFLYTVIKSAILKNYKVWYLAPQKLLFPHLDFSHDCVIAFFQIFGTIPWQAYFQRVLSVRSGRQAQLLSVVGAFSAVILAIPSVVIGAVAVSASKSCTVRLYLGNK